MLARTLLLLALLAGSQVFAQDDAQPLSVSGLKVAIEAADGSIVSSAAGAYPKPVLSNPQVPATQTIEVTFSVKKGGEDAKPQQAMLMLTSQVTGVAAYAVAKAKKDGSFGATINSAAVEKQLGKQDGAFSLRLIVGDPAASAGVNWDLGSLELLPSAAAGTAPKDAVRTASFQPANNAKPEIIHIFRAPDKRAPAVVSLAFTGLAVLPLVIAVLTVMGVVKVNFKAWPTDASTSLAALVFHGSLAAMLGLFLLFWLRLNLSQTLPLVGALGLVVALSGYKTLSGVATQRLLKEGKKD